MSVIPCQKNSALEQLIRDYAEALKTEAHKLGAHGLTEEGFYNSGLFRGAIERVRGQFSASMNEKREFVRDVLNYMQDQNFIQEWSSAGSDNRHDYSLLLKTGRKCVIELKGCLDGNNTTLFERPPHAQEFIIWSICTNPGSDPRKTPGLEFHTRLSAEIIERKKQVDGVMISGYGLRYNRAAVSETSGSAGAAYCGDSRYASTALHLCIASHDRESTKQSTPCSPAPRRRSTAKGLS